MHAVPLEELIARATPEDAARAFNAYITGWEEGVEEIGRGEDRAAFLVGGLVYKVGSRATANPYDHETLESARRAGMPWAPPSELFAITDGYGDRWPVMAMPYLVDDGTEAEPDALARMHVETGGQVDMTNYVVRGGQPMVLDGCTVRRGDWFR